MMNSPDRTAEGPGRRSVSDCMADLIRCGKDAQMLLEPIRSFCEFVGYDDDSHNQGQCNEESTITALQRHVDSLHHLFEMWDDPTFEALVPDALMHLKAIHNVVDNALFTDHVGTWGIVWCGLYNAVAGKRTRQAQAG